MDYIEFSAKIKEKYPEYKDVDDLTLAQKIVEKYPEYKEKVTFEEVKQEPVKKGIDLTPSGLAKQDVIRNAALVEAPFRAIKNKQSLEDAYTDLINEKQEKLENSKSGGILDFGVDMLGYSGLPILKGSGIGNFAGNAVIQGGVPGAVESLKRGGNVAEGAGVSTGIAAALQGITPQTGKLLNKVLESDVVKNNLPKILEGLTSVPAEYSERALVKELNGQSILDGKFDPKTAYIPIERKLRQAKKMMPNAESYADEFYKLGQKAKTGIENLKETAGQEISDMLGNLKAEPISIQGLKNSLDSLIKGYSRGGDINPATVRAGRDIDTVKDLLGIKSKEQIAKDFNDYFTNNRLSKEASNLLTEADKEAQDVAFNVLSRATGKDKNWLKSQLNANMPKMSTQKRQEFIENLLENTDDRIETGTIDPTWLEYFPELNQVGEQYGISGRELAQKAFDKIMRKDFKNAVNSFDNAQNQLFNELDSKYDKVLYNLTKNPTQKGIDNAFVEFDKAFGGLEPGIKEQYVEKLSQDIENIQKIGQAKVKPIDLHNAKEILYDIANYNTADSGIRNDVLKGMANQINNYLRNKFPQYIKPNDKFAAIKKLEYNLGGTKGINSNTIGGKLSNYGSPSNIESGLDRRLKDINYILPQQNRFIDATKNLVESQKEINNIINTIGKQYERNPRLLANRTDEAFETAINDLQKKSGVNFMEELNDARAREALEKFFPGQGGGSGSSQGFGNLLRTALLGGSPVAAVTMHNPAALLGLAAVSPKLTAKGTIKNLGKLNNVAKKAAKGAYDEVLNRLSNLGAKGAANLLYGGVEYNDYQ